MWIFSGLKPHRDLRNPWASGHQCPSRTVITGRGQRVRLHHVNSPPHPVHPRNATGHGQNHRHHASHTAIRPAPSEGTEGQGQDHAQGHTDQGHTASPHRPRGRWDSINPLESFFRIEGFVALDRNPEPGYNTLLCDWSQEIYIEHVPIDSSTQYPAF